jgi:hypothetical protein
MEGVILVVVIALAPFFQMVMRLLSGGVSSSLPLSGLPPLALVMESARFSGLARVVATRTARKMSSPFAFCDGHLAGMRNRLKHVSGGNTVGTGNVVAPDIQTG